jgi:hypothetical protein
MNNVQEVLAALGRGEITQAQAAALIQAAAAPAKKRTVSLEVSEKGAVKIKGLRSRWPIVLYPTEVETILSMADKLVEFIEANRAKLSFQKGDLAVGSEEAA